MKVCPVCKSRCFDDMKVCYGCMHEFIDTNSSRTSLQSTAKKIKHSSNLIAESKILPEYFEIAKSPIIEDTEFFNNRDGVNVKHKVVRGNHEKRKHPISEKNIDVDNNSKEIKIVIKIPKNSIF